VDAIRHEIDMAIHYHEAWKPTAFDQNLHGRMGTSRASVTFGVVQFALRQQMLLSLMKVWDRGEQSIRLEAAVSILRDKRVTDALEAERIAQWEYGPGAYPEGIDPLDKEALRAIEADFGHRMAAELRQNVHEFLAIIDKYESGEGKILLGALRKLRNQTLAHRQLKPTRIEEIHADGFKESLEEFYADNLRISRLLNSVVAGASYNPDETAEIFGRDAALFWAPVRGERTPGHPNYWAPPMNFLAAVMAPKCGE
jgi:hypothetical protein